MDWKCHLVSNSKFGM